MESLHILPCTSVNVRVVNSQSPKIGVVNSQNAEKSWSKFDTPLVLAATHWLTCAPYTHFLQLISRYLPEEIAIFSEQMYSLKAFLERNPQLFATSPDRLR